MNTIFKILLWINTFVSVLLGLNLVFGLFKNQLVSYLRTKAFLCLFLPFLVFAASVYFARYLEQNGNLSAAILVLGLVWLIAFSGFLWMLTKVRWN